ncbi:MAG TPA: 4-hydroxy-3-methylbut-2-en-1-yl diphosphate synthase, partial [Spirochaetes bacterium]|nr:4-hydroxy-3-methylbut-2-en-1-yl diphosphate synthase [Spirochaetota bacterium]
MTESLIKRRHTRKIKLGGIHIGGDSPITIQSMTTTDTANVTATVDQIKELEDVGCDIIRIAVPNMKSAKVIHEIKE